MAFITRSFVRSGADEFNPIIGQGRISFASLSGASSDQVLVVPHLGLYCPAGGIGNVSVYWENPLDGNDRIVVSSEIEADMQTWDGSAYLKGCPGLCPRNAIEIAPDGQITGGQFWDLVVVSDTKTDDATASYSFYLSPNPSQGER